MRHIVFLLKKLKLKIIQTWTRHISPVISQHFGEQNCFFFVFVFRVFQNAISSHHEVHKIIIHLNEAKPKIVFFCWKFRAKLIIWLRTQKLAEYSKSRIPMYKIRVLAIFFYFEQDLDIRPKNRFSLEFWYLTKSIFIIFSQSRISQLWPNKRFYSQIRILLKGEIYNGNRNFCRKSKFRLEHLQLFIDINCGCLKS